jgi:5-methylthioribose kinase
LQAAGRKKKLKCQEIGIGNLNTAKREVGSNHQRRAKEK